jgi:hypothetical protein
MAAMQQDGSGRQEGARSGRGSFLLVLGLIAMLLVAATGYLLHRRRG